MNGTPNLSVFEGSVEDVLLDGEAIKGIVTADGTEIACKGVVVTTGTFLRAKCYIGQVCVCVWRRTTIVVDRGTHSMEMGNTLKRFPWQHNTGISTYRYVVHIAKVNVCWTMSFTFLAGTVV